LIAEQGGAIYWFLRGGRPERVAELLDRLPATGVESPRIKRMIEPYVDPGVGNAIGADIPPFDFEDAAGRRAAYVALMEEVDARTGDRTRSLLAEEARVMSAPADANERQMIEIQRIGSNTLEAIAADPDRQTDVLDTPIAVLRATRSAELLAAAIDPALASQQLPAVITRIETRSDELLDLARDERLYMDVRDACYGYAIDYLDVILRADLSRDINAEADRRRARISDERAAFDEGLVAWREARARACPPQLQRSSGTEAAPRRPTGPAPRIRPRTRATPGRGADPSNSVIRARAPGDRSRSTESHTGAFSAPAPLT
jgi:hypothetical protein